MAQYSFNILSLCSGIGGLELGLRLAVPAIRVVCYVEREAYAAAVLASRMQEGCLDEAPIWADLRTFDGEPWRGVVDCITAGYPCQPFSVAGQQKGTADSRHLFPDILRIVEAVQPAFCFFENVPGHLRLGYADVYKSLRALGYAVEAGLFSAAELGAPHRRQRLFILAHAGHAERWQESVPTNVADGNDRKRHEAASRATQPSEGMAYPAQQSERESNNQARAKPRQNTRTDTSGYGQHMAEAGGTRRQQAERGQLRLNGPYPPGPQDLEAWRAVLLQESSLKPAICRMAHGSTCRLDRLRCLGNAVVPDVAAKAWVELLSALNRQGRRGRETRDD